VKIKIEFTVEIDQEVYANEYGLEMNEVRQDVKADAQSWYEGRIEKMGWAPAAAEYYQCGICEQYHAQAFNGDCRQDDARFNPEELDQKHGEENWVEVPMP